MNGIITGDMTLNAAIYQQEVCDVCLNCGHVKCINTIDGCEAFREAVRRCVRVYKRGVKNDGETGGSGRANAAGVVGGV